MTPRQSLLDGPVRFPAEDLGVLGPAQTLPEHLAAYGPRRSGDLQSEALLAALADIGLTGRGGGHFPAARKWLSVRAATQQTGVLPIVVANGAEGEPASAKDAALLSRRPHLVLDGLAAAGEAVGATESVVWLHGKSIDVRRVLALAVRQRRAAGQTEAPVRLASGPGRYLTGESSAVVRALSGGPALPESRLEPTAARGVNGRPTLLHNVETLARVGLLARTGVTDHRPTTLVTVLAGGRRTVLELDETRRVGDAVRAAGWPAGDEPQAVLVGGYGGSWLRWTRVADVEVTETALRAAGASLGAGILALLPRGACGLAETARVASYLADSSARQCGPCLFGLASIADVVTDLRRGTARHRHVRTLRRWSAEVSGRGACHHPDGAVRMVLSALECFAPDVEAHGRGRPCPGATGPALFPIPAVAA